MSNTLGIEVVSPDHLLDVTELARCIGERQDNVYLALLGRFEQRTVSEKLLAGTLINAAFDTLVRAPERSTQSVLDEVLHLYPLAVAAIAAIPEALNRTLAEVRGKLESCRQMIASWSGAEIMLEAQYISPSYGLQGRLDILLKDASGIHILEMKSGKAPSHKALPQHAAQVSAYKMMYEAAHNEPVRSALVWYVGQNNVVYEVPNTLDYQKRLLAIRNELVTIENELADRKFGSIKQLGNLVQTADFDSTRNTAYNISQAYNIKATPIERTVVQTWLSFLAREQNAVRVTAKTRSASDLWRTTLEEKRTMPSALTDMRIVLKKKELTQGHFVFERTVSTDCALRVGDIVLVYPELEGGYAKPADGPLLRGTIREMSATSVELSMRDPNAEFSEHKLYIIEQDVTDSGLRNLYSSSLQFLRASPIRKQQLLGQLQPIRSEAVYARALNEVHTGTNEHQRRVIAEAVSTFPYYLLQGPPGTGKTSVIIRGIIHTLLNTTTERVLLLAFTNRAVDELCTVLEKVAHGNYVRHGSKHGAGNNSSAIAILAQDTEPTQVALRITTARIVVATIQSMHTSPEIYQFGGFDTVIVDEASQVLEPLIMGIIAQANRAIFIGDQCQLPAVVTQSAEGLSVNAQMLAPICVTNLGMSYFERMIRVCERNSWDMALGFLEHQGRMHVDIMQHASRVFYNNKLKPLTQLQSTNQPLPWHEVLPNRACMLSVAGAQQQELEAKLAVQIVRIILLHSQAFTIGVITPFRVQNNRILQLLTPEERAHCTVDTVERFQGSERDVIVYATSVGSLEEFEQIRSETLSGNTLLDRKLNVAITRAREQFVLIGNPAILRASQSYATLLQRLPIVAL